MATQTLKARALSNVSRVKTQSAFTTRRSTAPMRPSLRDLRVRAEEEPQSLEIEVRKVQNLTFVWSHIFQRTHHSHLCFPTLFTIYRTLNLKRTAKRLKLTVSAQQNASWWSARARQSAKAVATPTCPKTAILSTPSPQESLSSSSHRIGSARCAVLRKHCSNRSRWRWQDLQKTRDTD